MGGCSYTYECRFSLVTKVHQLLYVLVLCSLNLRLVLSLLCVVTKAQNRLPCCAL